MTNAYVASRLNIRLSEIQSINLINKVDELSFEHIIDSELSKTGAINYIIFECISNDNGHKLIYFLINEQISEHDFNRLTLRFAVLRKGYLYYQFAKTTDSSIQSAKTQYKDKNLIQENRVDSSQWQLHFNSLLEKAIKLSASDIHITVKEQTAIVKARVHGDLDSCTYYKTSYEFEYKIDIFSFKNLNYCELIVIFCSKIKMRDVNIKSK